MKATNKTKGAFGGKIGRIPVCIPPDAEDCPEIDDEHEMKFIADPKDPDVRALARLIGWERVKALDES